MDWKTDESAFTLLEMLFVLSILAITLPFVIYLMQQIQTTTGHENASVQHFFVYLRNDALRADEMYGENNRLHYKINEFETATIERYDQVIRRRINGKGHEIYLRHVESFHVQPVDFGFHITITTTKGVTYEKTIASYEER